MRQGKLYALMLLPEGLLRGIMDGTNTPVTIVFPENAGLEAAVFRELADAGTQILKRLRRLSMQRMSCAAEWEERHRFQALRQI